MATVTYTLSGNSVTFAFTPTSTMVAHTYQITYTSGALTGSTTIAGGGELAPYYTTITGLESGQTYNFSWDWSYNDEGETIQVEQGSVSVVTPEDTPKTARMSQWEDLATRIKAKSDVNITMTTTDPEPGSALAENNFIGVYGGDPIIMDYSSNEIDTGVKWIDGSAIYKKTLNTGTLPSSAGTSATTVHNITDLYKVIKIEGYAYNGTVFSPLPYISPSSTFAVAQILVNTTSVMILASTDLSAFTESYVTLYYTKSS